MAKSKVFLREADIVFKEFLSELESDILSNLKKYTPEDDTTPQKAYELYQQTGHWAWIKDDTVSSLYWKVDGLVRDKEGVKMKISNKCGYIAHLVEGFITVEPEKWQYLFALERTTDGQFSEQSPLGDFVDRSLVEALEKHRYDIISKGKFGG